MPSSTFLNLPAEKQEKLLEAATREFTRRPFNEASINQIIKDAGIPRGSFYMYFTDKEDLFRYLVAGMWTSCSWCWRISCTAARETCSRRF